MTLLEAVVLMIARACLSTQAGQGTLPMQAGAGPLLGVIPPTMPTLWCSSSHLPTCTGLGLDRTKAVGIRWPSRGLMSPLLAPSSLARGAQTNSARLSKRTCQGLAAQADSLAPSSPKGVVEVALKTAANLRPLAS